MKRFIKALLLFLVGCVIAAFAVANREPVRFVVDPFIDRDAALSIKLPLFVFLFVALFAGIVLGALAVWMGQRHWRKAAQTRSKEAALWKREAETLKAGLQAQSAGLTSAPRQLRSYF